VRRYLARNALLGFVVGGLLGGMVAMLRGLLGPQKAAQPEGRA
jgi:hypothetical protein